MEICVNIGCGSDWRAHVDVAKRNKDKLFIGVDPLVPEGNIEFPDNLQYVQWGLDEYLRYNLESDDIFETKVFGLPFKSDSVEDISIEMLYGQIDFSSEVGDILGTNKSSGDIAVIESEYNRKYGVLLNETYRVLKPGGKIRIVDSKFAIGTIVELLKEAFFDSLVIEENVDLTVCSFWANQASEVALSQEDAEYRPVEIIAFKN